MNKYLIIAALFLIPCVSIASTAKVDTDRDYCEIIRFPGHTCVLKCSMNSNDGGIALVPLDRQECDL